MARPTQLIAVTLVYLLGTVIAVASGHNLDQDAFWWSYAALILISMSIHYANEYADYDTDAITKRTPFSGGSGALHYTGLERHIALQAARTTLIIGFSVHVLCLASEQCSPTGSGVLAFGAFFGWMYSLKPLKLAWRGWGELDNAALGGVVLPSYGYVTQSNRLDWEIVALMLPFGCLVFINLLATTWADREADAQVGKYTLATRYRVQQLRILYGFIAGLTFLLLLLLSQTLMPTNVALGSTVILPLTIWGMIAYTRVQNPFPTVAAMVVFLGVQLFAWSGLAGYTLPLL
jgi:1,4-dihydroxy-2-naphthoate octaprenyltransferase